MPINEPDPNKKLLNDFWCYIRHSLETSFTQVEFQNYPRACAEFEKLFISGAKLYSNGRLILALKSILESVEKLNKK